MFLSILIPNFGYSDAVHRCFESLKNQISDEIEVLICDQSDNATKEFVIKEMNSIANSKIISLDCPDVLEARKTLLRHAKGKYILFIDSDDYIEQDFLRLIMDSIIMHKYPDLLITSYTLETENASIKNDDLSYINEENLLDYYYYSDSLNALWRKIFKRSLYCEEEINNLNSTNGDDWIVSLSVMKKSKVVTIDSSLCGYHYCVNPVSLTNTMTYERFIKSFSLKDCFLPSGKSINKNLLFESRIVKFFGFCCKSYQAKKDKNEIKQAFKYVRKNLIKKFNISIFSVKKFKRKIFYIVLKLNLFHIYLLLVRMANNR